MFVRQSVNFVLQPYPSWDWHSDAAAGQPEANNCSGIVSVLRVRADRCNRLWVLDSGVVDSLVNFRVACPPKLLVFDMQTDQLVSSLPCTCLLYTSITSDSWMASSLIVGTEFSVQRISQNQFSLKF